MNSKHRAFITAFFCIVTSIISCQTTTNKGELSLNFRQTGKQYQADTAYIANFLGDNQIIIDTIVGQNSNYHYSFKKNATPGIYRFLLNDTVFFDFIFNNETIEMSGELSPFSNNSMQVIKSDENKALQQYLLNLSNYFDVVEAKKQEYKSQKYNSKEDARLAGDSLNRLLVDKYDELTKFIDSSVKFRNSVALLTIKTLHIPRYSNYVVTHNDKSTLLNEADYNATHLFDNIVFSDARLLRSPYYFLFLQSYWSSLMNEDNSLLKKAANQLLTKSKANQEVFDFTLNQTVTILNMLGKDEAVYYIIDSIASQNSCSEHSTNSFAEKKNQIEQLRPGKPAPIFTANTDTGLPFSISNIKADAVILYFWRSDCGFCKETTPQLQNFAKKIANKNVKIIAISMDTDQTIWNTNTVKDIKNWHNVSDLQGMTGKIAQQYLVVGTPSIYLLDKNNIIIKRLFNISNLELEIKKLTFF